MPVTEFKQISSNLGHSNIGITFDTYGQLISGAGKIAVERLDRLLKPWLPEVENVGKRGRVRCAPRGIRIHDP